MKKFVFFCGILNYLLFNLSGSEIGCKLSNLNDFREVYEEQPNEFYNRRSSNATDNNENSLIELLLDYARLLVNLEQKELEDDLKVWFEAQIDTLLHLDDPEEYEICKEVLREDLEWYEVIYSETAIVNFLKDLKRLL